MTRENAYLTEEILSFSLLEACSVVELERRSVAQHGSWALVDEDDRCDQTSDCWATYRTWCQALISVGEFVWNTSIKIHLSRTCKSRARNRGVIRYVMPSKDDDRKTARRTSNRASRGLRRKLRGGKENGDWLWRGWRWWWQSTYDKRREKDDVLWVSFAARRWIICITPFYICLHFSVHAVQSLLSACDLSKQMKITSKGLTHVDSGECLNHSATP